MNRENRLIGSESFIGNSSKSNVQCKEQCLMNKLKAKAFPKTADYNSIQADKPFYVNLTHEWKSILSDLNYETGSIFPPLPIHLNFEKTFQLNESICVFMCSAFEKEFHKTSAISRHCVISSAHGNSRNSSGFDTPKRSHSTPQNYNDKLAQQDEKH